MKREIKISAGQIEVKAYLNETNTAKKVWDALPITASANTWGDEIYFAIPVQAELENAKELVSLGDIGYWPPGKAMCLFFGKTPISKGDEIRPASAVNIIGKIEGDPKLLKMVKDGETITIRR
ncbi:MAG TPA: cyclophilin-like fold protein [Dehalococcoidia bacterium]|nr:cyclophilin-like fold protein [Dehalococcoidia bacterium]